MHLTRVSACVKVLVQYWCARFAPGDLSCNRALRICICDCVPKSSRVLGVCRPVQASPQTPWHRCHLSWLYLEYQSQQKLWKLFPRASGVECIPSLPSLRVGNTHSGEYQYKINILLPTPWVIIVLHSGI